MRRLQNSTAARLGEFGVGEAGFGGIDAQVEPLQQLSAAIGIAGVGLRKVDVGVDEARQQKPGPVIQHRRSLMIRGDRGSLTTEGDRPAVIDDQCTVGNRYQCGGGFADRRATCDVVDMAEMNLGHGVLTITPPNS